MAEQLELLQSRANLILEVPRSSSNEMRKTSPTITFLPKLASLRECGG
jgi:hypothetical protein